MISYTFERRIQVFDLDDKNDLIQWEDVLIDDMTSEEQQINLVSMSIDSELTYNIKSVLQEEFKSIKKLFSQTPSVHLFPDIIQ